MGDLPWLLVYGRLLWPLAVTFAAAVSCLLAWTEARRRGRESIAWGRRELARPAAEQGLADGARAVIAGVLVVEGEGPADFGTGAPAAATTARAERRPDSLKDALDRSASLRAPSLALRSDDGALVHLDGPVAVLAGSREVWTGCRLPRLPKALRARVEAADEAGAAMLGQQHAVLAAVSPGDRVLAFGQLVARQDIRSAAVRWSLVPAREPAAGPDDPALAAIPLVYDGAPRVSGPLRRALATAALFGAAAAFAGLAVAGELARLASRGGAAGSATVYERADGSLAFRALSADLVMAASPFRRDEALRRVARQVRRDSRGEREVRAVAALWSLGRECYVGVEHLARRGRYVDAVALGERCGDPQARWMAAEVALLAGEARRASRLLDGLDAPPEGFHGQEVFAALAHLYAGRLAPAAAFLRRAADVPEIYRTDREAALRCGAAALAARAGDAAALADLRARQGARQGWRCALYLADLEQGPARLATLRAARERLGAPYDEWGAVDTLLRMEAGERTDDGAIPMADVRTFLRSPADALTGHLPALERAAHEALAALPDAGLTPARRLGRARLAASRAAFESLVDRPDEARRLITSAMSDCDVASRSGDPEVAARGAEDRGPMQALATLVEARAGASTARSFRELPARWQGELRGLPDFLDRRDPRPTASPFGAPSAASFWTLRYALAGAVQDWTVLTDGHGRELVSALTIESTDAFGTSDVAFGVRRLASDRELVRAWFAWGPRQPCWRCQARFAAAHLSHVAMTARALGLPYDAAPAEHGLAGFREMLLRRDAAVAALLIETM